VKRGPQPSIIIGFVPQLHIIEFGRRTASHSVDKPIFYIGRDPNSDLLLAGEDISRRHCRLIIREGCYHIEDLQSSHGLWLNGLRVYSEPIESGARIQVGPHTLLFEQEAGEVLPWFDIGPDTDVAIKADLPTLPEMSLTSSFSRPDMPRQRMQNLARTSPHLMRRKPKPAVPIALKHSLNIVGAADHCHVRESSVEHPEAAEIQRHSDGSFSISRSARGIELSLNGKPISESALVDGDLIEVGRAHFVFRTGAREA